MSLQTAKEAIGVAGGVLGVATGLCSLFPKGREWVMAAGRFVATPFVAPWLILRLTKRIEAVEYEVKPNSGGSMNDKQLKIAQTLEGISAKLDGYVQRSEARFRHDFQAQRGPAFELDAKGRATLVSFALGRLCHVEDAALELSRLAYLQFLDAAEREEFLRTFRESAADGSMFRMQIRWFSRTHDDRGLWDVRAVPLDAKDSPDRLYSAVMLPIDDVAKDIARRNGWWN